MAVPGDCRNTLCISKSSGAVMGKQIHSKPCKSLWEAALTASFFILPLPASGKARHKRIPRHFFRPEDEMGNVIHAQI